MPTFDRRPFIPLALQNFLCQDYPNKELVIVDDGTDPIGSLVEGFPGVRYIRLSSRTSIGAKRNLACQEAHGEIIAHWDDDDWYAPNRVQYQTAPILSGEADITGLKDLFVMTLPLGEFWITVPELHERMFVCDVHGGTLVYHRSLFLQGLRYPETDLGEDADLVRAAVSQGRRLKRLPNQGVFVYVRHDRNAWQFETGAFLDPDGWKRIDPPATLPSDVLEWYRAMALMGEDQSRELRPRQTGSGISAPDTIYLDSLPRTKTEIGYGTLGIFGTLGYDDKLVKVQSRPYLHSLSAHPPARIVFPLGGRFKRFVTRVAINDGVPAKSCQADFSVFADGRLAAVAHVTAGSAPQNLEADIRGTQQLELMVRSSRPHSCHAVWLDPYVDNSEGTLDKDTLSDCLNNVDVDVPMWMPKADCCIATVVSPGYTDLLDDMLGSLHANGGCHDALLVVFVVDGDEECMRVVSKYGAFPIRCATRSGLSLAIKAVIFMAPQLIDADKFLYLDSDMLVLKELRPIFSALDVLPNGSILACREGHDHSLTLDQVLIQIYGGSPGDIQYLMGTQATSEGDYPLFVNSGLFAGSDTAFLEVDQTIRSWPRSLQWMQQRDDIWWREQFLFNLVLAHRRCGVELDAGYNVQLHVFDVDTHSKAGRMEASWRGQPVKVLHFSGTGRNKYPEWRNLFSRVEDPLVDSGEGDGYGLFLTTLRSWIGRYGLRGLSWSFYGTSNGATGRVRDSSTMPLWALLHYLVRANGCIRVLETGTARGISAACLASAVAQRPGGRVITFDPYSYEGRTELWAMLPWKMRVCIEQRPVDALAGLTAALAAGEQYEAALLDSLHTVEHVWAEFQLATRLVCRNGLILIHDARFADGEVPQALERIEADGYRCVRLWCADAGICEDDDLGLAIIENTPR